MAHRRSLGLSSMALAPLLLAIGCDVHEPVSIPPGATEVHVEISDQRVTLTPASVPAGDIYLVLEGPGPAFEFVSRMAGPDAEPEPMDSAQVERVRGGDLQSTMSEGVQVSCGVDEWSAQTHWEGCGNVFPFTVEPGLYVIRHPGGEPGVGAPMAVLEVEP